PTIAHMFAMINAGVLSQGTSQQNVDLNTFSYSWQPPEFRIERFPFARVDLNLNTKQRLSGTFLIHKITSDPDIVNSGFSSFPGVAVRSTQYSYRQNQHHHAALDVRAKRDAYTANIYTYSGGARFDFMAPAGRIRPFAQVVLGLGQDNGIDAETPNKT